MIRTTATRGGETVGGAGAPPPYVTGSHLRALASLATIALLLAACTTAPALPPVTAIPTTAAACEALRPNLPIRYSSKGDTAETVRQVRAVNARFASACP